MLPPRAMGTIARIAEKGSYTVEVSFLFYFFAYCHDLVAE